MARQDKQETSLQHSKRLALSALQGVIVIAAVLVLADVAAACPTCKDNLAHDPATSNLARGFYYSILFMISMPFLIFGSLCSYFYWEVRRARARQAAATGAGPTSSSEVAIQAN